MRSVLAAMPDIVWHTRPLRPQTVGADVAIDKHAGHGSSPHISIE
jgi:hypothetical protein